MLLIPSEKVLCCVRMSNADLIVTSERIINQSLPFLMSLIHLALSWAGEAILGLETSAWLRGDKKVIGGESLFGPSTNPQNVINPKRIIHAIPFDEITQVSIQPYGGTYAVELHTKGESPVFTLSAWKVSILWHSLPSRLKHKVIFSSEEIKEKISALAARYFR